MATNCEPRHLNYLNKQHSTRYLFPEAKRVRAAKCTEKSSEVDEIQTRNRDDIQNKRLYVKDRQGHFLKLKNYMTMHRNTKQAVLNLLSSMDC